MCIILAQQLHEISLLEISVEANLGKHNMQKMNMRDVNLLNSDWMYNRLSFA